MNGDQDALSPAEEQLVALLAALRAEGVEPSAAMVDALMRTAHWQVVVRGTVFLIGDLIGSMAAMLRLFASSSSRDGADGR
jgi:hypothetical protein